MPTVMLLRVRSPASAGHALAHLARGLVGEGDGQDARGVDAARRAGSAMRVVITRVLPVPAPARTSSGPSVVETASRCAGFSAARRAALPPCARSGAAGNARGEGAKGGRCLYHAHQAGRSPSASA